MKKIFLAFALLSGLTFASAQQFTPRIEVGANFANHDVKNSLLDHKIKTGLRVGAAVELGLSTSGMTQIYLAPGLTYRMSGTKFEEKLDLGLVSSSVGINTTKHELVVPVNIGLRARFAEALGVSVEFGPYFAYGLSANLKGAKSEGDGINLYDTDLGFKRFDSGIGASVALEYNRYFLRLGAEYGFIDLNKVKITDNYVRNMGFFTTLGIRF